MKSNWICYRNYSSCVACSQCVRAGRMQRFVRRGGNNDLYYIARRFVCADGGDCTQTSTSTISCQDAQNNANAAQNARDPCVWCNPNIPDYNNTWTGEVSSIQGGPCQGWSGNDSRNKQASYRERFRMSALSSLNSISAIQ